MAKLSAQFGDFQLGGVCFLGLSDVLEKQVPEKADQATIGNDTHMDC